MAFGLTGDRRRRAGEGEDEATLPTGDGGRKTEKQRPDPEDGGEEILMNCHCEEAPNCSSGRSRALIWNLPADGSASSISPCVHHFGPP